MNLHLFVAGEREGVADVVGHELTPDGRKSRQMRVRVVAGSDQLGGDGQAVRQPLAVHVHGARGPDPVLVLGLDDPQVRGTRDPPHRVLDVVAFAVRGPVLLREAEGGLHVWAHLRQHGVLDRDPLDPGTDLASPERVAAREQRHVQTATW